MRKKNAGTSPAPFNIKLKHNHFLSEIQATACTQISFNTCFDRGLLINEFTHLYWPERTLSDSRTDDVITYNLTGLFRPSFNFSNFSKNSHPLKSGIVRSRKITSGNDM